MSPSTNNGNLPIFKLNIETSDLHADDEEDLGLSNDANGNASSLPMFWGVPLKYIS